MNSTTESVRSSSRARLRRLLTPPLLAAVFWLAATLALGAAQSTAAPQKPPATPPAQKSEPKTQPAPAVIVCPEGQTPTRQQTPFGTMTACVETSKPAQPPAAAPAPATPAQAAPAAPAPAAPAQAAPAEAGVTTQTGAKPAAPGAPAAAPPASEKPAGGAVPQPIKVEQSGGDGAVALNLENADLYQVLRILAGELKINYIVDPGVKGAVTINTSGNVSRKDLFSLLQMILEINGATAVKSNGYYAIVPLGNAKQQPLNFHFAKEAEAAPPAEDAYSLLVLPMRFISAAEMSKILTPFMSAAGQIVVQDKGNIMLITESAAKLKQLQEIVNVFDDPVLARHRVRLFQVTNNLATNLVVELKTIFSAYGLSSSSPAIQFVPMERLNSILAVSPSPEVFDEVEQWIKKLDQPSQSVGIRNFVYKVQNAKASELRDIINTLYGGSAAPRAGAAGAGPSRLTGLLTPENPAAIMGPVSGTGATQTPAPQPATQAASRPEGGGFLEGSLRITADDRNNALIVQATPHDYEIVERTLHDLDVLPRQVLIDARIYEVDLTGDLSLGISAFLDKRNKLADITRSGSFAGSSPTLNLQTFAVLPNAYELQVFLSASENRTRVKTLSAPSILVTDNTTARIQVGSEVPVPIGSALTPVQSGGSSVFAQTIQFRDTGVILSVTPRINASGIVTLDIAQEVSSAQPNATSAIVAPVISKSQFQTTAILRDNQTLALGGIITTSSNNGRTRVPLLGDIPGIGMLFGTTSLSTSRKELVLMITPHVARDMDEAAGISSDFVAKLKNMRKQLKKDGMTPPAK